MHPVPCKRSLPFPFTKSVQSSHSTPLAKSMVGLVSLKQMSILVKCWMNIFNDFTLENWDCPTFPWIASQCACRQIQQKMETPCKSFSSPEKGKPAAVINKCEVGGSDTVSTFINQTTVIDIKQLTHFVLSFPLTWRLRCDKMLQVTCWRHRSKTLCIEWYWFVRYEVEKCNIQSTATL